MTAATITDRRLNDGRRATDRRRSVTDFTDSMTEAWQKALEAREQLGAEFALNALVGDVIRIARDLNGEA